MEKIQLNGKEYSYVCGYRDDETLRNSFNRLTMAVFGFDLSDWYSAGLWTDSYVPHSLTDGSDVVANVSANLIDFDINGETRRLVQLGTVMTDETCRSRGLARYLMERVIETYCGSCDFIYLFANSGVTDLYPKFGFKAVKEYRYVKGITPDEDNPGIIKLNMKGKGERKIVADTVKRSLPHSPLAMKGNIPLVLYHCCSVKHDSVFYVKDSDAVIIADFNENVMYLDAVYSPKRIDLDEVIAAAASKSAATRVRLGFTPEKNEGWEIQEDEDRDTALFILGNGGDFIEEQRLRFPELSHA